MTESTGDREMVSVPMPDLKVIDVAARKDFEVGKITETITVRVDGALWTLKAPAGFLRAYGNMYARLQKEAEAKMKSEKSDV